MKFIIINFNEICIKIFDISALYTAVEKENIDIIKLLFTNNKLDINFLNIIINIFIKLKVFYFNVIHN